MSSQRKKILVLRYRFIGDTILTVPFLRNLRYAEPDAHIAWMVAPGSDEVIKGIPYVDELIHWDPVTIHAESRGRHRTLGAKLAFVRELRGRRFDTVYVLKRSFSSALLALATGARNRVGFDTEHRGFLLTRRVPYRSGQHEVLSFLDVLKADGIPVRDDFLEIWTTPEEEAEAALLLGPAGGAPLLAVHPFGSIPQKTWPMERFAAVADVLSRRYGLLPVILGGPQDQEDFVDHRLKFPRESIDLVGTCRLRTTIALLRRCSFFVGNDSGIMHLAAAAGVPLLALFGPTSPTRFGPWGEKSSVLYSAFPCSPCRQKYFTECSPAADDRPACIDGITVEEVAAACDRALQGVLPLRNSR